ncbi:MAG TPA: hypothetical protein VFV07_09015, partial [Rhizomicrobium sp.]|nr:hypothetical protein [Rhizomicrobium sp.]
LNATDLANMLATQEVTIQTGAGADTITVAQSFSWTSSHRLTLQADLNVSFQAPITVAGPGSLIIQYATGGAGDLIFFPGASVTFWDMSSTFSLQGQAYKLEPSLEQLTTDLNIAGNKGNFALANDFDETGQTFTRAPLNGEFGVTLEGAGHTIANLVVHLPKTGQCAGLFDELFGSVSDLNVTNADVSTIHHNTNAGIINGCGNGALAHVFTSGNVTVGTDSFGGGLSGDSGSIRDSSSAANVTAPSSANGTSFIGGLVGENDGAGQWPITNSSASGNITGGDNTIAGGLVGFNAPGAGIRFSHASGNVTVGNQSRTRAGAGGLVGVNYAAISQSFATGNVSGGSSTNVGGLVGYGTGGVNSYATGSALCTTSCSVGGMLGSTFSKGGGTGTSYSTASVGGGSGALVGGVIGDALGNSAASDTYWDLDTSGVSNPSQGAGNEANLPGLTGLSDTALKSALPAGFDPAVWGQKRKINHGYPYLLNNPPQ